MEFPSLLACGVEELKPGQLELLPALVDLRPRLGHIGYMSAIAKSRIDPELKRQAEAVLEEIGLKPRAALELFYKQIIKRRAIPFPVQADSPEDEVLSPPARRNALADEF